MGVCNRKRYMPLVARERQVPLSVSLISLPYTSIIVHKTKVLAEILKEIDNKLMISVWNICFLSTFSLKFQCNKNKAV